MRARLPSLPSTSWRRPSRVASGLAVLVLLTAAGAEADPAVAIRSHHLETSVDVAGQRIHVVDELELEKIPPNEEPFRFLLNRELEIESCRDVRGGELQWSSAESWNPRHFWDRPPYAELDGFGIAREIEVLLPAGERSLRVTYGGVIADTLHSPERAYGRSFETTSGRIVEKGAYLSGATFWVPWTGSHLFGFDLTVETPSTWRVVSQGELKHEEIDGSVRRTRWLSPDPGEEIYLIAGPYEVRELDHRGVRVRTYCYAGADRELTGSYLQATGPILDRFDALFGPYPYTKFALVENYWQTGYGMPSFTFLGDRVIRLPFIIDTSYPHEILHNWWGNGVYVKWDQGNWCEGLTTYCADYFAKERESPKAARDYRRSTLLGYRDFAATGENDFPLVRFRERDSAATQAVGYGKTLMVFHMLRQELGDPTFFGSLRLLYERRKFQRAGWDDVRAAFESKSGRDLAGWFEQWIRRPGAPSLSLHDVTLEVVGEGYVVRGELHQQQPLFDVPVTVRLDGPDHTRNETVLSSKHVTPFSIPVDFRPQRLSADPGFDLFRLLHPEEVAAALSGVLGANRVRVVLGDGATGDVREALLAVAQQWAEDDGVEWQEESGPVEDFEGATWFLGPGNAADGFLASLPRHEMGEESGSLVLAGRLEGRPDRPAALLFPESADVVPALARKVSHYSKYSYLRFEGTRNLAKGSWEAGSSPLTHLFPEASP